MAYEKHEFENGQVLAAEQLNRMEEELARKKSWNELADRPFWEETTTGPLDISWDGDMTGKLYYTVDSIEETLICMCRVLDKALTAEDLSAGTVSVYSVEGSQDLQIGTGVILSDLSTVFGLEGVGLIADDIPMVVSLPNGGTFAGGDFEAGTYFACFTYNGVPVSYTSRLSNPEAMIETVTTKKLDNKYLDLAWLPVYTEGTVEILAETSYSKPSGQNFVGLKEPLGLEVGETYAVTWNGVEYVCVAGTVNAYGYDMVYLGDISNATDGGTPASGEPFGILEYPEEIAAVMDAYVAIYVNGDGAQEAYDFTIGILYKGQIPNKIPLEFLPETTGDTGDAEAGPPELTGGDDEDLSTLAAIKKEYEQKGSAVCKYGGNIYAVLGILFDFVDGRGKLLLARVTDIFGGSPRFGLYVLEYSSSSAVLLPYLTDDAMYLDSSTNNSTKRFKITVDDSGTLTATEVT